MAYEVDYLPVGAGEKSGDAIAIRYGNLCSSRNEQTVIVIDGGTPSILNRIVGPIGGTSNPKSVIVSASTGGAPKHPAPKVTNAYLRRGANVVATQGQIIRHHSPDCPLRPGWGQVAPIPFYMEVDE